MIVSLEERNAFFNTREGYCAVLGNGPTLLEDIPRYATLPWIGCNRSYIVDARPEFLCTLHPEYLCKEGAAGFWSADYIVTCDSKTRRAERYMPDARIIGFSQVPHDCHTSGMLAVMWSLFVGYKPIMIGAGGEGHFYPDSVPGRGGGFVLCAV